MNDQLWSVYDKMAEFFQQHAADSPYNAHYDRPAMLGALGSVAGLHVLDAGCGPGLYIGELLARGALVTAFDASPAMVEVATAAADGRARIDRAILGEPLPYQDEAFDRIVCALAIHHAADRHAAYAEFYRVLRPGGAALVSTSHPFTDWLRKGGSYFQAKLETDTWQTTVGEQPVQYWTEPLSAVCAAATSAGFLIEQVIEPLPASSMRDRFPRDYEKLTKVPGFLILRLIKTSRAIS